MDREPEKGGGEISTKLRSLLNFFVGVVGLAIALVVALSPGLVFAPAPRAVLFVLISLLPAILFADVARATLNLKLPGFAFTVVGSAAVVFGGTWTLMKVTKPDVQVTVFRIVDSGRNPIQLDVDGVLTLETASNALSARHFVDGNTVVVIFPEQLPSVDVVVEWPPQTGQRYYGHFAYAGTQEAEKALGTDLVTK